MKFWQILVSATQAVGGQAVIEGVMMRAKNDIAIAVRRSDGTIITSSRVWYKLTKNPLLQKPFIRGFFALVESMVNGIIALQFSSNEQLNEDEKFGKKEIILSMVLAFSFSLGIFVGVPHLLSIVMGATALSGDATSLSFHLWAGIFKISLFILYVVLISRMKDIYRVFQYHGAEHKVIWAYEKGKELTVAEIQKESTLHPRCGTAFLLFVLIISVTTFTLVIPLFLEAVPMENPILRHSVLLVFKIVLMVPISAMAYEVIKFSGRHYKSLWCRIFSYPGLLMQKLTTREPEDAQVEVALTALKNVLGEKKDNES